MTVISSDKRPPLTTELPSHIPLPLPPPRRCSQPSSGFSLLPALCRLTYFCPACPRQGHGNTTGRAAWVATAVSPQGVAAAGGLGDTSVTDQRALKAVRCSRDAPARCGSAPHPPSAENPSLASLTTDLVANMYLSLSWKSCTSSRMISLFSRLWKKSVLRMTVEVPEGSCRSMYTVLGLS